MSAMLPCACKPDCGDESHPGNSSTCCVQLPFMKARNTEKQYDVFVAGSGFSGAILSLVLQQLGLKVCLVDKTSHPRFAIGESSTPIANVILRDLGRRYGLQVLESFSRFVKNRKRLLPSAGGLRKFI